LCHGSGRGIGSGTSCSQVSIGCREAIVELTLPPGASVALVARAHGVNANQVFKWRLAFERGGLSEPGVASTGLLPVTVSARKGEAGGRCSTMRRAETTTRAPSFSSRSRSGQTLARTHWVPAGRKRRCQASRTLAGLAIVLFLIQGIQLQAGFAHFLAPAIPVLPNLHPAISQSSTSVMSYKYVE
jgi:transposase-like protein